MSERSKLQAEVTSNVGGQKLTESTLKASVGDADATNEFIIVTLLVASTATAKLQGADTGEDLRQTLRVLGSTSSSELLALEVIWQPEGRGDVLTRAMKKTDKKNKTKRTRRDGSEKSQKNQKHKYKKRKKDEEILGWAIRHRL